MSLTFEPESPTSPHDMRKWAPRPNRHKAGQDAKRFRAGLFDYVGGDPSMPVRALIDRAVRTKHQLDVMDKEYMKAGLVMSYHNARVYSALNNSLVRIMRELKTHKAPEPPAPIPPTALAAYLAAHATLDGAHAVPRPVTAPDATASSAPPEDDVA